MVRSFETCLEEREEFIIMINQVLFAKFFDKKTLYKTGPENGEQHPANVSEEIFPILINSVQSKENEGLVNCFGSFGRCTNW